MKPVHLGYLSHEGRRSQPGIGLWLPSRTEPAFMNASITPELRPVITELDAYAKLPQVAAALAQARIVARVALQDHPAAESISIALSSRLLGTRLPAGVGSLRVVVTRSSGGERMERHRNSTQYLLALDGPLETHVQTDQGVRVDRYGSPPAQALDDRWHIVPLGRWHKTVAPRKRNWAVAAFHSARVVSDEFM